MWHDSGAAPTIQLRVFARFISCRLLYRLWPPLLFQRSSASPSPTSMQILRGVRHPLLMSRTCKLGPESVTATGTPCWSSGESRDVVACLQRVGQMNGTARWSNEQVCVQLTTASSLPDLLTNCLHSLPSHRLTMMVRYSCPNSL